MSDELQTFAFNVSEYERPTQKWTCGRVDDGGACHVGPTAAGQCSHAGPDGRLLPKYECTPICEKHRWRCARPHHRGGACRDGPRPTGACSRQIPVCQPRLSLRAGRRRLVVWTIVATAVFLFVALVWPRTRAAFISPGGLSSHHSAIIQENAARDQDCAKCHDAGGEGAARMLTSAFSPGAAVTQSLLCLDCHHLGDLDAAMLPHGGIVMPGLSADKGVFENGVSLSLSLARLVNGASQKPGDPIACSTCHQEHKGRDFNMKHVENAKCQVCHQTAFGGFSEGHPAFTDRYAFDRPTRLQFDHTLHYDDEDFELKGLTCGTCHRSDATGRQMLVNEFDVSCDSCHGDWIETPPEKAVAFLALPDFARRLKRVKGISEQQQESIGFWPQKASGKITPFMRILLRGDAEYPREHDLESDFRSWQRLKDERRFSDQPDDDLAAVARLADAIRRLADDLVDSQALKSRLAGAVKRRLTPTELDALAAGLPGDGGVRTAMRNWLSGPSSEVPTPDAGADPDHRWIRVDRRYEIRYRPTEHADAFVRAWLDLAMSLENDAGPDDPGSSFAGGTVLGKLGSPDSPGNCLQCHGRSRSSDGRDLKINWHAGPVLDGRSSFTEFLHAPHLGPGGDASGCRICHQDHPRYERSAFEASYESEAYGEEPGRQHTADIFTGNFAPMRVETCTDCHNPERAGDSCLKCHTYHPG